MAARGSKRSGGNEAAAAPLKGALREEKETPDSLAMKMVLERLESMERTQRLELQALQSALTASTEHMKSLQAQIAKDKRETAQAIEALHQQFRKTVESRPSDPRAVRAMTEQMRKEARENMVRKHEEFLQHLKDMPTGTVYNDTGKVVRFILNQVDYYFQPGENKNVPQAFVDAWESQQKAKKWAAELDLAFQSHGKDPDANAANILLGKQPLWDKDLGRI